ncbi:MAG: class I SAM-dependent methyltransferase [Candidatus Korobacteraceae bacterium]
MSLDRTQAFFHQYANDFDAIYGNQNGPFNSVINHLFRKSMRLRFEKSIGGCNPIEGKSVLDVGCGPGHYAITLAQRGAARVVGIDFADGMLQLASEHAKKVGVGDRCKFMVADFYTYAPQDIFDYVIVMGFMDYMPDAEKVVAKVLSLTKDKAFFSFPVAGGFLGWQRALRYKKRCDLFLYSEEQLQQIFSRFPEATATIEPAARDYFVTLARNKTAR